ncbi:hypothetical protein QJS10_CPB17g02163 [Acorus calamus]|uniref:Amino acid transporter transmembrane domain-containing protein n=1 Tax=Acorus calamus TaxID=4465 RepID=A0AAV9CU71_ACOCL|nr:hypothetical protein QJS10_CPB17g02163 [Acorus calamus]
MTNNYKPLPKTSDVELQNLPQDPSSPAAGDADHLPLITPTTTTPTPTTPSSGVPGAVFNLATSIIGAGIMALPATMKVLGVSLGLLLILLIGLLSELSIEFLVRFSARHNSSSYGQIVESALGTPAKALSEVCIVVNNAGILVVYLIIIGDVMSGSSDHVGVLDQLLGDGGFWDHRRLVILVTLIAFLAPLCALEKIDSLSLTSAASVALAVVFVIVACAIASVKFAEGKIGAPRFGPDFGSRKAVLDLLVVIPIMTNAYVCHFNVQPIYNELEGKSPEKMNRVGRITTLLCVVVYASTAVSGYLLFGDATESDVLVNFDRDLGIRFSTALNYVVRIGYVMHLILVFPVIHFSFRATVFALLFKTPEAVGRKKRLALTAVLLGLIYLGSTTVPNIWVAFKFTGATTALMLGFIFPALIALRLGDRGGERLQCGERALSWLMLGIAVVVSVIGVAGNIYSLESQSE